MKFKIESSEKDYILNYFVYYKTSFFGRWKQIRKMGFLTLDECIKAINDFRKINEELKNGIKRKEEK